MASALAFGINTGAAVGMFAAEGPLQVGLALSQVAGAEAYLEQSFLDFFEKYRHGKGDNRALAAFAMSVAAAGAGVAIMVFQPAAGRGLKILGSAMLAGGTAGAQEARDGQLQENFSWRKWTAMVGLSGGTILLTSAVGYGAGRFCGICLEGRGMSEASVRAIAASSGALFGAAIHTTRVYLVSHVRGKPVESFTLVLDAAAGAFAGGQAGLLGVRGAAGVEGVRRRSGDLEVRGRKPEYEQSQGRDYSSIGKATTRADAGLRAGDAPSGQSWSAKDFKELHDETWFPTVESQMEDGYRTDFCPNHLMPFQGPCPGVEIYASPEVITLKNVKDLLNGLKNLNWVDASGQEAKVLLLTGTHGHFVQGMGYTQDCVDALEGMVERDFWVEDAVTVENLGAEGHVDVFDMSHIPWNDHQRLFDKLDSQNYTHIVLGYCHGAFSHSVGEWAAFKAAAYNRALQINLMQ